MFVHNINPTLLQLGPFEVRWYGLVYVIGFILAYYVLYKKRDELKLSTKEVDSYVFYLLLGVIIGSRLVHVLWELPFYLQHPVNVLYIWQGGMAFHGGLVGVVLVTYWFCNKKNVSFAKLADILSIPAVFALALGRIANFINGELWGTLTNVPWCVKFPDVEGCRHPVQLYSAAKRFIILGVLLVLNKRPHKDGFIFWNFVGLMGLGRFFIDFMREDTLYLGLSLGQYFSLVMVIVAGYVLWRYYRK